MNLIFVLAMLPSLHFLRCNSLFFIFNWIFSNYLQTKFVDDSMIPYLMIRYIKSRYNWRYNSVWILFKNVRSCHGYDLYLCQPWPILETFLLITRYKNCWNNHTKNNKHVKLKHSEVNCQSIQIVLHNIYKNFIVISPRPFHTLPEHYIFPEKTL